VRVKTRAFLELVSIPQDNMQELPGIDGAIDVLSTGSKLDGPDMGGTHAMVATCRSRSPAGRITKQLRGTSSSINTMTFELAHQVSHR
jgi:hypothetical protein